jgi:hypothetical protein
MWGISRNLAVPAVVAVAALVVAVLHVPGAVRSLIHPPPARSLVERELVVAYNISVRPEVLLGAEKAIPRNATYAIAVGNSPPVASFQVSGIPSLLEYWLLPRKWTPDLHKADWIVSYNHPSETLGVRVKREIPLVPAVNVVEVGR